MIEPLPRTYPVPEDNHSAYKPDLAEPAKKTNPILEVFMVTIGLCVGISLLILAITGMVLTFRYCGHWLGMW